MPGKIAPTQKGVKLSITQGEEKLTQWIEADPTEFTYTVHIGSVTLRGLAAHLVTREDGTWLRPVGGRLPILVNGTLINRPVQLSFGDTIQIGTVTCHVTE